MERGIDLTKTYLMGHRKCRITALLKEIFTQLKKFVSEKITETSEFCMTINMDTQSSSSSSESSGQQDSSMPGASHETAAAAANTSSIIPIGCAAGDGNKMQEWRRKNSAEFYDSMTMSQNSFVTVSTVSPSCSSMLEAATDAPGDNEIWGSPPQAQITLELSIQSIESK